MRQIDGAAFVGCSRLKTVYYEGGVDDWKQIEFTSNPCKNGAALYVGGELITEAEFGGGHVPFGFFDGCESLRRVVLKNGVETIGARAFAGCSSLCEAVLPDTLKTIAYEAFAGCGALEKITLPASIASIPSDVFGDGLQLWYGAFIGCTGLKEAHFRGTLADWCHIDFGDDVRSNPCSGGAVLFIGGEPLVDAVIPQGVERIKAQAFYGVPLSSVTIPTSVRSIGCFAFDDRRMPAVIRYSGSEEQWNAIVKEHTFKPGTVVFEGSDPQ